MPKKRVTLASVDGKLNRILAGQKKLLRKEREELKEEEAIEGEERKELSELEELEEFEKEIKEEVGAHPLRQITYKDIAKGTVGAFVGVAAHYTFVYGVKVAHQIDVTRATLLFPVSYALGAIFMYVTGFRKIKDPRLIAFLPLRLTVLYLVAIMTAALTLLLFNPDFFVDFWVTYKQIATVTLSATIGACTADLIGKE